MAAFDALLLLALLCWQHYAPGVPTPRKTKRPMEQVNVTRIEHENVESAVRENARSLQRLERKVDDLAKEIAALQKAIRALTPLS